MKTNTRKILAAALLLPLAFAQILTAASVTDYDSIVSLATNATKNYTFTDAMSGQSVVIAVTMTAYDPTTNAAKFYAIDGATHVGVDGNIIEDGAGANFSAALVSAGNGVVNSSIKFNIGGAGIRPVDDGGYLTWTSSVAGLSASFSSGTEVVQALDTGLFSVSNRNYSAQMRFPSDTYFQLSDAAAPGQSLVMNMSFTVTNLIDPRTNSWFTTYSGQYARIYTNNLSKTNGLSMTTWTNTAGETAQALPVYCGVQEVYSSSNWVYIRSSGLPGHIMGPWYLNTAQTQPFPNYPTNEHVLYRIPRNWSVPATKTRNDGGAIGYFVDGAAMFNSWDAYTYTNGADSQGGGDGGYWNRDAYVNEGPSFDPNNAHQAGGQHHYHANPPALRYQLGDHVDFNSVTKAYPEDSNTPTKHSPILAWTSDGFPVYGPYGYSVSNNASSGIRRMISGYVLRNGQNHSQNLTSVGRADLPQWAVRLYNNCPSNVYSGPAVSTSYPLGRYMEDNDYLGDLGYQQGVTNADGTYYDLDEYNGRWCVTPDFPGGTYAYFVSISTNGTPTFPYNIARGYYGNPTGGVVSVISESVNTNFIGGPNSVPSLNSPTAKNGTVTLTWSATEGGTYMVTSTTNLSSWTTNSTTVSAVLTGASYTNHPTDNYRFYRTALTSLASYDSAGSGGYVQTFTAVAPGGSASRGTTVTVTITLPSSPPNPPANAPITSVTLASSISGTGITDATSGTVIATFTIPSNASTGNQSIVIVFGNSGPTYTVTGLTID